MASVVVAQDSPAEQATDEDAPVRVGRLRRFATGAWPARLVTALAGLPVVAMLIEVAGSGRLQHLDYLYQLVRITNPDGSLKPFSIENYFSNEHFLGLPTVVYWINIHLFAGDNRTLGVFVVAVAAGTVLALGAALPRSLPPLARAGLVAGASALVFSLHGLWNFTRAMSGTAWLTANLLVVLSLLFAARGRWWPSWSFALLGSLSYGSAFAVWPVLALVAVLRRETWWRRLTPLLLGGVLVAVWLVFRQTPPAAASPTTDLGSILYFFLAIAGKLWAADSGGMAAFAGAVILALYGILAASPTARERRMWFWWALGAHAFLFTGMISLSRVDYGGEVGMHTARYTSASVLLSVPVIVLLAAVVQRRVDRAGHRVLAGALVVGVLGYALGAPYAAEERKANEIHHVEAVAIRGGFSDAYRIYPRASDLVPRLRALGHYPFTDDFTLGCGGPELGSTLDLAAMEPLSPADGNKRPEHAAGEVERTEPADPAPFFHGKPVPILHGWAADHTDPVRCVVIVDGSGTIVGGGVSGIIRPDIAYAYAGVTPWSGFSVIGPVDDDSRVVVLHDSGAMHWLPARSQDTR